MPLPRAEKYLGFKGFKDIVPHSHPYYQDHGSHWQESWHYWQLPKLFVLEVLTRMEAHQPRLWDTRCQSHLGTEEIDNDDNVGGFLTCWSSWTDCPQRASKQINVPKVTPKSDVKLVKIGSWGASKTGSKKRFCFQYLATKVPDLSNTKLVL